MDHRDAVALLGTAVPRAAGIWADFGAGDGTFTRALVELLGSDGRVYAVERDLLKLAALEAWAREAHASVTTVRADFTAPFHLPGLAKGQVDGLLIANALHYSAEPGAVLAELVAWLRPRGRVVLVEYDRRRANQWVPYPIAVSELRDLAAAAGLAPFTVAARRPSAFSGELYVAFADRP
ncbi:MAG TPA: class I SAM-dependent methyltransferase [Gemmatimonadaceae bacterium]